MANLTINCAEKPKARSRRWFQFSLRTLLVMMLGAGLVLGWLAQKQRESQIAWSAIHALIANGEVAFLENDGNLIKSQGTWLEKKLGIDLPKMPGTAFVIHKEPTAKTILNLSLCKTLEDIYFLTDGGVSDEAIAPLANLGSLRSLGVSGTAFTGAGLLHFSGSNALEKLHLGNAAGLTAEGLRSTARLPRLKLLGLAGIGIDDTVVQAISQSRTIEELSLEQTSITDQGLLHLQQMQRLTTLNLHRAHVTDQGLEHLAEIATLRFVDLSGTDVTPLGVKKLRAARPLLKIVGGSDGDAKKSQQ